MKLFPTYLIVSLGLLFTFAMAAQGSTNEPPATLTPGNTTSLLVVTATDEQPVATNEAVTAEVGVDVQASSPSSSQAGTPFEQSPYTIILEKMPFGTPPNLAALSAAAASIDEAKMKVEQDKLAATFSWTAINITPDGKTAIGFTDLSAKPPANYYMTVGESANNWTVLEADYTSETATIEKDGVRISLKFGNKSPITPTAPGAPTSPTLPGAPTGNLPGHNHGPLPGIAQPIVETHTITFPAGGGRPATTTSHSALLTSYRDRLNERLKAQESQKQETDRKQKEELSKLVTVSITDALRKQQEEAAAAAAAQQGEIQPPQVQQIEIQGQ